MPHKHLLFRSEAREKTLLCQHWPCGGRESEAQGWLDEQGTPAEGDAEGRGPRGGEG